MTTRLSLRPSRLTAGAALCAAVWTAPAYALRPFEGTDASVAEPGIFELELGPVSYLRSAGQRGVAAPAVVGNFGFEGGYEFVIEGKLNRTIGQVGEAGYRTSVGDTAMSVKHVLREGSLQEGHSGVSVAMECGLLSPEYHGVSGTGATCAGIVSQRFDLTTVHLNGALTRTRNRSNGRFLGVIVEGSENHVVRPVMEVFTERENNGAHTRSGLLGLIWKHSEDLAFDLGLRHARSDGVTLNEVKFGLTWSYAMHKQ